MITCVNLGCGDAIARAYEPDQTWFNLDFTKHAGVDIVADLEEGLPFGDSSVDFLFASHVFEHIHNFPALMKECDRVLKPRGVLFIRVPVATCRAAFGDPTHYNRFVPETWEHFSKHNDIGYDTLGLKKGMGLKLVWNEVINYHNDGLDDGVPGSWFSENLVEFEKDGPPHEWEERLVSLCPKQ